MFNSFQLNDNIKIDWVCKGLQFEYARRSQKSVWMSPQLLPFISKRMKK
jgi:hypothetical protein